MGVDLGIVNIAADSKGQTHLGGEVNSLHERHTNLRQRLQQKGTKSATRLLKKRRRKEQRVATNENPCMANQLVTKNQDRRHRIVMES